MKHHSLEFTFLVITVHHIRDFKQFHWKRHLFVTTDSLQNTGNECCPGNLQHSITMVTDIAFFKYTMITLNGQEKSRNGKINL